MAKLKDKIQNALDESRMPELGAQVLLGFQFVFFYGLWFGFTIYRRGHTEQRA